MTLSRNNIFILVAFVCMLIASLDVAGITSIGPALAWVFGGLAAWMLAQL